MDLKRRQEVRRAVIFLVLGFVQTTGAVTTILIYSGLGFHWVTWICFGVTSAAFVASRFLRGKSGKTGRR